MVWRYRGIHYTYDAHDDEAHFTAEDHALLLKLLAMR